MAAKQIYINKIKICARCREGGGGGGGIGGAPYKKKMGVHFIFLYSARGREGSGGGGYRGGPL